MTGISSHFMLEILSLKDRQKMSFISRPAIPDLPSAAQIALHHHQRFLHIARQSFFLTWFDRKMEQHLDNLWFLSPSTAFALHEQMMDRIFSTLRTQVPQVCAHGCAPLPTCTPEMNRALGRLDLGQNTYGQLNHAYAALTFWPWQGGCSICSLKSNCPKQNFSRCA